MVGIERGIRAIGGRHILVALGSVFVLLASSWALMRGAEGRPILNVLITFGFSAGPGIILLYSWFRLPRTDIDPKYYPIVGGWCLGGVGVAATILILYHVQPDDNLARPIRTILALSAVSSIAGLGVGFHDAQSRTREREVERQNQELQRTQNLLQESNERLEQFAHAASHDLQEPLRMITNYLGLIEQRYASDLDESGVEFIEFAVDGADRMKEMINGLLEFSRVESESQSFIPVDLNEVVADVRKGLELQIDETSASFEIDELPHVRGDERRLRQVFQNLFRNAIEYCDKDAPRIQVSAQRKGTDWIVFVKDNGIGISTDDHDRIFEVFQRLHTHDDHPGTGIGLALCKRIVEQHGGQIWVESDADTGSMFSFTLPAPPYRSIE